MATGLAHGKIYKVQSVFDGAVLDLSGADTSAGTKIITYENNNTKAQRWLTNKESHGLRFACVLNHKWSLKVIDMHLETHELYYNGCHADTNQQFYSEAIGDGKYLIRSSHNHMAVRNQGQGRQVKCVPADKNDVSQQWKLQEM